MHQRAHFDTLTRPLPTSRPVQSLREYPFLSLGLFSLNIWHTHTQHTHTPSPEHTIHPHPRLYDDHSRLCFFAPQHAQHLNLQRGHRADRRRRPHHARECGVIWKQGDVMTADWLLPPPSLSIAQNYQSLSPPHKIVNPSTHEILPLSSMFFQLSHHTCCLFSFHVYRIQMHMHLMYITCIHLSHRPNFFLSLSLQSNNYEMHLDSHLTGIMWVWAYCEVL